jgi:hypothetical protein
MVSFTPLPLYPRGQRPTFPLDRRVSGPQSRSERYGKVKTLGTTAYILSLSLTSLIIGPPLWSSGQSSWLQSQRSGFDSRHYQIFWEVVGMERDPFSLVSTAKELLGRKSSGSSLENREYAHRDPSHWPRDTHYPRKLALTSWKAAAARSV